MKGTQALLVGFALAAGQGMTACDRTVPVEDAKQDWLDVLADGKQAPSLVVVPAGIGTVGGKNFRSFQNEEPSYQIRMSKPFAIGAKEITFAEFDRYCQASKIQCPDDEGWGRGEQPVVNVSWHDAVGYTEWLSRETGKIYRLPTEVEWEYAARAGRDTKFWWGDEYKEGMDHCDRTHDRCPKGTDQGKPMPAGHFSQNPLGLYDVTSNVSEWVFDCYTPDHTQASRMRVSAVVEACSERVMKGASWLNPRPYVHLSARFPVEADAKFSSLGFRILRELDAEEIQEWKNK